MEAQMFALRRLAPILLLSAIGCGGAAPVEPELPEEYSGDLEVSLALREVSALPPEGDRYFPLYRPDTLSVAVSHTGDGVVVGAIHWRWCTYPGLDELPIAPQEVDSVTADAKYSRTSIVRYSGAQEYPVSVRWSVRLFAPNGDTLDTDNRSWTLGDLPNAYAVDCD